MTERDNRIQIFFAISIALHLLVFRATLMPFLSSLELPSVPPLIEIVELPKTFRSPQSRERPPPAPEAAPAPIEKPVPPETRPAPPPPAPSRLHDVVAIPKPAVEQTPRDTRFLAEYSQRVERPARARDRPIDNRGDISKRKAADPLAKFSDRQSDRRASETQEAREAQQARARAVAGGGGSSAVVAGAPGETGLPERVDPSAIFRRKKIGDGGHRTAAGPVGPGEGLLDLLPKEERLAQLEAASRGGRSNPYNPDLVPVDAEMSMDTLEFEHVGYYLTIKRRFSLNWDPTRLIRSADESYQHTLRNFGGNSALARGAGSAVADAIARTGRGTTVVSFTILKTGRLEADPVMLRSSGSAFLDEEALRAVRFGDPFPPVPDRLAKNSLKLTWAFIYGKRRP